VFKYPHLYRHNPSQGRHIIKPRQGTYERWYVANIGNAQPFADSTAIPDMHPFHIHLVNFVVLRRWRLDGTSGVFKEVTLGDPGNRELDFDGLVRHDTVRIPSNELVELLVYFPNGYTGHYPYHCHLVEHEDMGMMLHFDVQP
jgi:FtsP/CotA-like multicopper oxidase with cupredoxin domain